VRRQLFSLSGAALLAIVTASAAVTAQARFESGIDLVALDVCVTDRQGHPVTLGSNDLVVLDNGGRQQIVLFSAGDRVPLAVTLLVDSSQGMHAGLLAGHLDFDEVLDEARRSGILVYAVVLPPQDAPGSGPPWQMTQLALDTGGETVAARRADDPTSIYEQIAADGTSTALDSCRHR
jgi:hypothetical protein